MQIPYHKLYMYVLHWSIAASIQKDRERSTQTEKEPLFYICLCTGIELYICKYMISPIINTVHPKASQIDSIEPF